MISDDCLLVSGAVRNGVTLFEKRLAEGCKVGALAFYWRSWPEQTKYHVNLTLGDKMFVNHGLYLRSALEEVGWIDEDLYRFYHADGDLCLKLWEKGFEVVDGPASFVEHFTHSNRKVRAENQISQQNDWKAYLKRWTNIYYDPAKNNIGGRLYSGHIDPLRTVTWFPRAARLRLKIASIFKHVRNGYVELVARKRIEQ